jgi:ankyrin repeat protein
MSKELIYLCVKEWSKESDEASFDSIKLWLDKNKAYPKVLREAAHFKDEDNATPLHYLVAADAPLDLVRRVIELAPRTVKVKNYNGALPLHLACKSGASYDILNILLEVYPRAARETDNSGNLPLHIACANEASHDTINIVLKSFPEAVEVQRKDGCLPLHIACAYGARRDIVMKLLEIYPDATEKEDNNGKLPSDYAEADESMPQELKTLLQPKTTLEQRKNWWDPKIYINNKTKHSLRVTLRPDVPSNYWKDSGVHLAILHDKDILKAKQFYYDMTNDSYIALKPHTNQAITVPNNIDGMYSDISCNDNLTRGWVSNFLIHKGTTITIRGEPLLFMPTLH